MSDVLRFPDPRVEEQATTWIARLHRGLLGTERTELARWLDESNRHREALLEAAELWDRMDVLSELAELFPLREEVIGNHRAVAWPTITALVVLLGLVVTFFHFQESTGFTGNYTTAIGEQRTVELPDHSKILLNTNTALQVQFSRNKRLITMARGEANFEVAKNPAQPFTVSVAGIDFTAVGTAFNVRADSPRDLRLAVTEGRVHVHDSLLPAATVRSSTAPGMSTRIDVEVGANAGVAIDPTIERIEFLAQTQVAMATAWQQGMVAFHGTPLEQVVAEFGRYSTARIVIAEPELGRVLVSGYFRVGDIDGLSAALKDNFDIEVYKDNDLILLKAIPSK